MRSALPSVAALLAATLALGILAVRLSSVVRGGGGKAALLGMVLLWGVGAVALLWRAASSKPWPHAERLAALAPRLWVLAGVLVLGSLLTVTRLASLDPVPLAFGALVVLALAYGAPLRRWWRPSPRAGAAIDALVVVVLVLVVVDLVVITPEDPAATPLERFVTGVIQFHHDFLLGPANQVLGGHPMLVDTASQYGVGSIYFLAGWFELVPIGYGSLGLLDGLLTALSFVAGYGLLRIGGASRLLAAVALGVGTVVLVLARVYPVGALPQEGPLRFGLPLLLVLATVAAERWPRRATAHGGAGLRHVGRVVRVGARGAGAHRCHVRRDGRLSGLAAARRRSRALAPQAGGDRACGLRLRAPAVRRRDARLHR